MGLFLNQDPVVHSRVGGGQNWVKFGPLVVQTMGGYDYFLLLLSKSSFWFTERHYFFFIRSIFNTLKCTVKYVI